MKSLTKKSLSGISLLIGILLLAGAALAANNVLTITVVDDSGKAIAGAKVDILALGTGGKWQTKKADNNGVAKWDKLDDGVYRIVARPDGMAPALYELVLLRNGAQEAATIKCSAGDPAKKFYFDDPALGQKAFAATQQGVTALQNQKLPEAEQAFKESLEGNPSDPNALFYMGVTLAQEGKWDEARTYFQSSLKMATALVAVAQPKDPKNPKAEPPPSPYVQVQKNAEAMIGMLPGLKLKVEGNDEMTKKNYKQAIAKFEEAAKVIPGDPDTHYYLALALGMDKQWDAAGKAIDKAIALRSDDKVYTDLKARLVNNAQMEKVKVVADQGDAMYNSKDYAGALKKYEETLGMVADPTIQAGVYAQIAQTYDKLNQPDQAEKMFRKAIELAPKEARYQALLINHFDVLAKDLLDKKQYDQAFDAYAQAGKSVFKLGTDWANRTETADLAIMAFERVLKTEPGNAEALFQLGTVYYFGKKDNAKTKEYLSKYLQAGKDEKNLENARNIIAVIDRKK
jgi:tetratricopeptide (TPR) repeat protein